MCSPATHELNKIQRVSHHMCRRFFFQQANIVVVVVVDFWLRLRELRATIAYIERLPSMPLPLSSTLLPPPLNVIHRFVLVSSRRGSFSHSNVFQEET